MSKNGGLGIAGAIVSFAIGAATMYFASDEVQKKVEKTHKDMKQTIDNEDKFKERFDKHLNELYMNGELDKRLKEAAIHKYTPSDPDDQQTI